MLWVATGSSVVVKVATPPAFRVPEPRMTDPSLKLTVPPGTPPAGETAWTVAVNVTDWPNTLGVSDVTRAVVVEAWVTVSVWLAETLPAKLPLPPYCAWMAWEPTGSELSVRVATPLELRVGEPSTALVPRSTKLTVPV